MKVIVACLLVPLAVAQYSCSNCQTGYNTNSQYGTQGTQRTQGTQGVQRDPTSSGSEPGYLPDYQGDKYTDPQRIKDTQALNKPFFDSIGGAPSPPPLNPAQQGMTGPQYTNTGNNQQYQPQQQYQTQQYPQQNNMQYQQTPSNVQYQPVNTMYTQPQVQPQTQQPQYSNINGQPMQYPSNTAPAQQQYGNQPMYNPCNNCGQQPAYPQTQQQNYGRRRRSAQLFDFMGSL